MSDIDHREATQAARTIAAAIPVSARNPEKRTAIAILDRGLGMLVEAVERGQIPNVRLNDAKQDLADAWSRVSRNVWDAENDAPNSVRRAIYRSEGADRPRLSDAERRVVLDLAPYLHNVAGHLRRCEAIVAKHEGMEFLQPRIDALRAFAPVQALFEAAKPLAVKRAAPDPNAPPPWAPPPASDVARRAVYDALVAFTDEAHAGVVDAFASRFESAVERYFKMQDEHVKAGNRIQYKFLETVFGASASSLASLISHVSERVARVGDPLVRRADWKAVVREQATRMADDIRNQFVGKNLGKLGSIVDAKGSVPKIERGTIDLMQLSGTLRVEFDDGTSFSARNEVVFAYPMEIANYVRFPLTFHDVHMPDGSVRASMSQKEMNEEFVAAPSVEAEQATRPGR